MNVVLAELASIQLDNDCGSELLALPERNNNERGIGRRAKTDLDDAQAVQTASNRGPHLTDRRAFPHPFLAGITAENVDFVARRFLAISIGFPYAQAGSQSRLLDGFVARRTAPRDSIELTTVVANFLCWDETGGHAVVLEQGNRGLPQILDTRQNFHCNLLKHDLRRIFGRELQPEFDVTGPYLLALRDALGDEDDVRRCAAMVSFERHAALVITSFWRRLIDIFGAELGAELRYFSTHVGDDDPAEPYHVSMTGGMIERIVEEAQLDRFMAAFEETFAMHIRWSASCCETTAPGASS